MHSTKLTLLLITLCLVAAVGCDAKPAPSSATATPPPTPAPVPASEAEDFESDEIPGAIADEDPMPGAPDVAARLNLNEASREELGTIPGASSRLVREFLEYRPYVSIQQFRREIGKYVSDEQVASFEPYVYVPVDPNESDAETLQQLPGVDAAAAEALIEGRPYASTEAFIDALTAHVSAEEARDARPLLASQ